jgi:hypothetical protein
MKQLIGRFHVPKLSEENYLTVNFAKNHLSAKNLKKLMYRFTEEKTLFSVFHVLNVFLAATNFSAIVDIILERSPINVQNA